MNAACGYILMEERLEGSAAGARLRNEALKSPLILSRHSLYPGVVFFAELRAANVQPKALKHFSGWVQKMSFISASFCLSVCPECHGCKDSRAIFF